MKKIAQTILILAISVVMAFGAFACDNKKDSTGGNSSGGNSGGNSGGSSTDNSYTIEFYTSVNIVEYNALKAVANAYSDYQYDRGKDVTITINNNTDPSAYTQNIRNMASSGVSKATIVSTSLIPEYYGTDKIVDLTEYLDEANPYINDNTAWKDALETDAYRTQVSGSSYTIPGLSYSSNYLTVFYDKATVKALLGSDPLVSSDGTIDSSRITWDWMINALKIVKGNKDFKNPLGLSSSTASCGEGTFNMVSHLMNMYLDQYYRDFTQLVHSTDGDYSYISSIDSNWTYSQDDASIDAVNKYSYNLNKVVDYYFNQDGYNPTAERYKEVMENLYELMSYADKEASYNDIFSRFNETTLTYEDGKTNYQDLKLFYVEALDYVRTYRDAFKTTTASGATEYPSASKISSRLGWFLMPAMSSSLSGVADNVRAFGGPQENYGLLNTGNTKINEQAIDFLMYLFSPTGQNGIYASYKTENNAPITMVQLVKNVTIPSEIDYTIVSASGDCATSPYMIFGKGSGMTNATVDNTATYVSDQTATIISNYLRGSSKTWDGTSLFNAIKSGFKSYAENKNLIYTDYTQVATRTNNLKNSPFNTAS